MDAQWKDLGRRYLLLLYFIANGALLGLTLAIVQLDPQSLLNPRRWATNLVLGIVATISQQVASTRAKVGAPAEPPA